MCFCGRPLHYKSPQIERLVRDLIEVLGPEIIVRVGGRAFSVPRHYIALHGLKGAEVEKLGFREVEP